MHPMAADDRLRIERVSMHSLAFAGILALRARAYDREEAGIADAIDEYSLHFAAMSYPNAHRRASPPPKPLGCLRVTCRKHGPLESEAAYPEWLLAEFGQKLCASSRMCVLPELAGLTTIPKALAAYAWPIVLKEGVRIDVSKARVRAIPFYMKMGYHYVRGSSFDFEHWNARCGLIAFPAHPAGPSGFAHLFAQLADPCDLGSSAHAARFTDSYREFSEDIRGSHELEAR